MINKRYGFGFSWKGLVIYLVQLAPNIVWMLAPPANDVLTLNSSPYPFWDIVEHTLGVFIVVSLILVVSKSGGRSPVFLGAAALMLAAYYVSWVFYYHGAVNPWLLIIGMAATPPLCFMFAGLWLKNDIAAAVSLVFGAVHVGITCGTYL